MSSVLKCSPFREMPLRLNNNKVTLNGGVVPSLSALPIIDRMQARMSLSKRHVNNILHRLLRRIARLGLCGNTSLGQRRHGKPAPQSDIDFLHSCKPNSHFSRLA